MRLRRLGPGAGLALASLVIGCDAWGPTDAKRPSPVRETVATHDAAASPLEADPLPAPPERDIFRYGEAPTAAPRPTEARRVPARPTPVADLILPPPPLPLRLVGLVRRTEGLRAAVATSSGVVLVAPGDAVSGYTVLGVDEERGLRLRGPDGAEILLELRH